MQQVSPNWLILLTIAVCIGAALATWVAIFWTSLSRRQVSILSLLVLTTLVAVALALPLAVLGWR